MAATSSSRNSFWFRGCFVLLLLAGMFHLKSPVLDCILLVFLIMFGFIMLLLLLMTTLLLSFYLNQFVILAPVATEHPITDTDMSATVAGVVAALTLARVYIGSAVDVICGAAHEISLAPPR